MKTPLSSIPQLYRNMRRLTEIMSIFSKYGLADWLSRIHVDFVNYRFKTMDGDVIAHLSQPARLRMALIESGPTFIKLGQILSTRPESWWRWLMGHVANASPPDRTSRSGHGRGRMRCSR
jgi:ubiquinone biosynthesis protein